MPIRNNRSSPRGMNTQKDRGRRKKDHRPGRSKRSAHETGLDQFTIFEKWLADEFLDESGAPIAPSNSFGLKAFLQNTAKFDLAPDEKLRILAIHWEGDCASIAQPKGWNILKRIYREVLKYESTWATHFHSMSLSARACAFWLAKDDPQRAKIYSDARTGNCHRANQSSAPAVGSKPSLIQLVFICSSAIS